MKTFRTAIVGCGSIARVHERVLREAERCEIAACVDIRPERAWEMARRYGCPAYQNLGKMLKAERPDVIHLCTPHALHAPHILAAAEAGVHVFCEKPPAVSREQWAQVKKAAESIRIGLCFQNRCNPNALKARALIDGGEIGEVTGVRAFLTWRRDESDYRDGWHGLWETEGGGVLINQAIHTLDLLISFLGKPDRVEASMANHHLQGIMEEEDTAELFLTSGNKRGLLYATSAAAQDEPVLLEIRGQKGMIRLEEDTLLIRTAEKQEMLRCPEEEKYGKACWGAGHKRCITDFYASLESGDRYRNDPASCEDTMEALFQAYEQGKKHLAVEVQVSKP